MTTPARRENRRQNLVTGLVLAVLVLGMVAWGFFAFRAIGDRPPDWSYGAHPVIPAESYSSTRPAPPPSQAPRQVELPPQPGKGAK